MQQQHLPPHPELSVSSLASSFNNATNSYKFFWLLSILDHIQANSSRTVNIHDLLIQMVKRAWYPSHYFRLSFGKQDKLAPLSAELSKDEIDNLETLNDVSLHKKIDSLSRYVPYRFLRPFFASETRGLSDFKVSKRLQNLASEAFDKNVLVPFYRFVGEKNDVLELHVFWYEYLQTHLSIIRAFCCWHLVQYLQKHNPNVPGIPNKLFEPQKRDLKNASKFWKIAIREMPRLSCIYSNRLVTKQDISIDHFLPWSFVTHDLLWNLTPTTRDVNSAKGNRLPNMERYFKPFCQIQYEALQVVSRFEVGKLLEDYVVLFKAESIQEIRSLEFQDFEKVLRREMAPQFQIAKNLGFFAGWEY